VRENQHLAARARSPLALAARFDLVGAGRLRLVGVGAEDGLEAGQVCEEEIAEQRIEVVAALLADEGLDLESASKTSTRAVMRASIGISSPLSPLG